MKSQHGITILELLIALVLASILASFAIAVYGSSEPNCDNPNAKQSPLMRGKIAGVISDIGRIHMAAGKF